MANRNFPSNKLYTGHVMPVLVDCNFIVDSTNGNGLGIRSLKGPYVSNVYMHTSATPAAGNPNPPAGYILVQLTDNFNRSLTGFESRVSPLSGTPLTSVTAGSAYVITSVGTGTQAQYTAIGVPIGVTPAPGVAFVATASTTVPGGGSVQAPTASGIGHIETVGDPNTSIAPNPLAGQGYGASFLLQCIVGSTATAPTNGTVISLAFLLSNSSVLIAGE